MVCVCENEREREKRSVEEESAVERCECVCVCVCVCVREWVGGWVCDQAPLPKATRVCFRCTCVCACVCKTNATRSMRELEVERARERGRRDVWMGNLRLSVTDYVYTYICTYTYVHTYIYIL